MAEVKKHLHVTPRVYLGRFAVNGLLIAERPGHAAEEIGVPEVAVRKRFYTLRLADDQQQPGRELARSTRKQDRRRVQSDRRRSAPAPTRDEGAAGRVPRGRMLTRRDVSADALRPHQRERGVATGWHASNLFSRTRRQSAPMKPTTTPATSISPSNQERDEQGRHRNRRDPDERAGQHVLDRRRFNKPALLSSDQPVVFVVRAAQSGPLGSVDGS